MTQTRFDMIAFDADDTLWPNALSFVETGERFSQLLSRHIDPTTLHERLNKVEILNLKHYGYGIKSFTLSMIETAIEMSEGRVNSAEISQIMQLGQAMLARPLTPFARVEETLLDLKQTHTLMIITKGDLFEQEHKVAKSGLAHHFEYVEVVSHKEPANYQNLLHKYDIEPSRFLMIGNSLRSDIMPIVQLGGHAVLIPYEHTWSHENESQSQPDGFATLDHIGQLPAYVRQMENR